MQDEKSGTQLEGTSEQARSEDPARTSRVSWSRSRKWLLVPIIASLVMIGGLIMLGGTSAAPMIYSLF